MKVVCGARLTHRPGRCRQAPCKGKTRCKNHGGMSTGPTTPEGMARAIANMVRGRKAYDARMWALKQAGLIDKFPWARLPGPQDKNGRRIHAAPPKVDPVLAAAEAEAAALDLPTPGEPITEKQRADALWACEVIRRWVSDRLGLEV